MTKRIAFLTLLGLGACALAIASPAAAAPLQPVAPGAVSFGGVHVGVGVGFPVGRPYERHVQHGGYWTERYENVWVPGHLVGYDVYGRPIYAAGHYETRVVRAWVPVTRRVVYHPRPRGYVGFGLHFR